MNTLAVLYLLLLLTIGTYHFGNWAADQVVKPLDWIWFRYVRPWLWKKLRLK